MNVQTQIHHKITLQKKWDFDLNVPYGLSRLFYFNYSNRHAKESICNLTKLFLFFPKLRSVCKSNEKIHCLSLGIFILSFFPIKQQMYSLFFIKFNNWCSLSLILPYFVNYLLLIKHFFHNFSFLFNSFLCTTTQSFFICDKHDKRMKYKNLLKLKRM